MVIFRELSEEIEKQIRPATYPLAVKVFEKEEDIPAEAKRPKSDFRYSLSLCQAFSLSRREGTTIAMLKEDMWCPEATIGYGMVEPPEIYLSGRMWLSGGGHRDLVACKNYGDGLPRFEPGRYIGVGISPAKNSTFEPDTILVYGLPGQIKILILGLMHKDGKPVSCSLYGGACLRTVVQAVKTGKTQVTIPCATTWNLSQDHEMMCAIPKEEMKDLLMGLRARPGGFPTNFLMMPEHEMPEGYMQARKDIGYER